MIKNNITGMRIKYGIGIIINPESCGIARKSSSSTELVPAHIREI